MVIPALLKCRLVLTLGLGLSLGFVLDPEEELVLALGPVGIG